MIPLLAAAIPSIVGAIGSAFRGKNKIVDAGLDVVQSIVGHPVNSLNDVDYSKLSADQITALKTADYNFYNQYNDQLVKLSQTEIEDRKDARSMQASQKSYMPSFLTTILTFGLFVIIWLIFEKSTNLNAEENTLLNTIFGMYLMKWGDSISFWFGTSFSSRIKDFVGYKK
jgi:hypothetical protein